MTRHLQGEYGEEFCKAHGLPVLSGIAPGVLAQTGMETVEIVQGIVSETKTNVVVVMDALAARSVRRPSRTTQFMVTGNHLGSGVGNN